MNDVHKSPGGGKIKEGTLITTTKTSHRINSTAKKITGSMLFRTEDFTIVGSAADIRTNLLHCQVNCRRRLRFRELYALTGFRRAACPSSDGSSPVPVAGIALRRGGTFRRQYNGRCRWVRDRGLVAA